MKFEEINESRWIYYDPVTEEIPWQIILEKDVYRVVKNLNTYKYYRTLEAAKLAIMQAHPTKPKQEEPGLPWQ